MVWDFLFCAMKQVGIGKEHRLDVGIVDTHVFHAVFFLVATCKFMFFDFSGHIVVDIGSNYESILGLAVHCLGIDVVMLVSVLHEPSFVLEHLEVLCSLFIYSRVVLACANREVNLRLYDMV